MAKIRVILTEDIAGQGRKGDIISVSEGYANNFVIKNKKGILATEEELKKMKKKQEKEEKKLEEEKKQAEELKRILEAGKITIEVKTGENGKLFGAITNKEISSAIEETFHLEIDRKKIDCTIKTIGEHIAVIKLHTEVKAELKVVAIAK